MRVLQVHNRYRDRGGEDAVVETEARLLRAAGHEVDEHRTENPEGALPAVGALATSAWNPRAARAVRAAVQRRRPDVAHVHNTWFSLSAAVVAALADEGVPVVMTLHNYRLVCPNAHLFRDGHPCEDCVGRMPWPGVVHRCYRGSVGQSAVAATAIAVHRRRGTWRGDVDAFITMTAAGREVFAAGGLPAERIVVKPHSVADPGTREAAPSRSRTLLYVGRLAPGKGVETLLEAWERAAPADLTLDVVGDGTLRAALEARAVPGVRFLGWRPPDEVRDRMRRARALVFPSVWQEPFGLALVEALGCGLPVVGSGLATTREVLGAAADDALLCPPADPAALAGALGRAADDDRVDAVGRRARARYEDAYTPARDAARLVDIYRSVVAA